MNSITPTLEARALTKSFDSGFSLGPLNFSFVPGSTIGIMGQNGAGKTTLFEILTGNSDASSGEVICFGHKLSPTAADLRRKIGYLPQNPVLPPWVTPKDILNYVAKLYDHERAAKHPSQQMNALIARWDIQGFFTRPLGTCSYGMAKRVGLALATIHDPDLLILDEPFSGLDYSHVMELENAIAERRKAGKVTIVSTHTSLFAAKLCDQIYFLAAGNLDAFPRWGNMDMLQRIDAIEAWFSSYKAKIK